MRPVPLLVVLTALLALPGCGGAKAKRATGPAPTPSPTIEVRDDCGGARPAKKVPPIKGLLAPRGVEVEQNVPAPPNTRVDGYVPLTPEQFVTGIEKGDYKVLFKEVEPGEGEAMYSDGRHRNFWKLVQTCPDGSKFTALVGEEPKGRG